MRVRGEYFSYDSESPHRYPADSQRGNIQLGREKAMAFEQIERRI